MNGLSTELVLLVGFLAGWATSRPTGTLLGLAAARRRHQPHRPLSPDPAPTTPTAAAQEEQPETTTPPAATIPLTNHDRAAVADDFAQHAVQVKQQLGQYADMLAGGDMLLRERLRVFEAGVR